jgi:hypothetical protein
LNPDRLVIEDLEHIFRKPLCDSGIELGGVAYCGRRSSTAPPSSHARVLTELSASGLQWSGDQAIAQFQGPTGG